MLAPSIEETARGGATESDPRVTQRPPERVHSEVGPCVRSQRDDGATGPRDAGARRAGPAHDLTGAVTETNLEMFAADIAFQGADRIDLAGRLYNADLQIAHVDEKMRQRARQTYILCDSSKIGRTALACNGTLSDVDALITDDGIQRTQRRKLKAIGATVIVVRREE